MRCFPPEGSSIWFSVAGGGPATRVARSTPDHAHAWSFPRLRAQGCGVLILTEGSPELSTHQDRRGDGNARPSQLPSGLRLYRKVRGTDEMVSKEYNSRDRHTASGQHPPAYVITTPIPSSVKRTNVGTFFNRQKCCFPKTPALLMAAFCQPRFPACDRSDVILSNSCSSDANGGPNPSRPDRDASLTNVVELTRAFALPWFGSEARTRRHRCK